METKEKRMLSVFTLTAFFDVLLHEVLLSCVFIVTVDVVVYVLESRFITE